MKALNPLPVLLVVDDDLFVRKQVSHVAKPHFNVIAASKPCEVSDAVLDCVDTLVLDLNIPGSDAVAFMQSLASHASQIRLVLVSGLELKTIKLMASVARQLQFRSVGLLTKPFTRATLTPVLLCGHDFAASQATVVTGSHSPGLQMHEEMQRALSQGEFVSYFQPQFTLSDQRFQGVEALCRWQHPQFGLLGLGDFIAQVEEGPWALPFALYMADDAIGRFARVRQTCNAGGHLSINLPVAVLEEPRLAHYLGSILHRHAFPPQDLIVEITERGISEDTSISTATITQLRIMGVRISLDDFGTGYSSFQKLKDIAVDEIKIDKRFVMDANHSKTSQTLIIAALKIAEELDMQVVAEGIETEEVAHWLTLQGNIIGQGFLYSPPVPVDQLCRFMHKGPAKLEGLSAPVPFGAVIAEMPTRNFMGLPILCSA